jgi:hypothetical protein
MAAAGLIVGATSSNGGSIRAKPPLDEVETCGD